jgi:hypothetical protein
VLKIGEVLAFGGAMEKTLGLRGNSDPRLAMLTTLSTEDLIPADHPIPKIRVAVDAVLAELDPVFDRMLRGRRSSKRAAGSVVESNLVLMAM